MDSPVRDESAYRVMIPPSQLANHPKARTERTRALLSGGMARPQGPPHPALAAPHPPPPQQPPQHASYAPMMGGYGQAPAPANPFAAASQLFAPFPPTQPAPSPPRWSEGKPPWGMAAAAPALVPPPPPPPPLPTPSFPDPFTRYRDDRHSRRSHASRHSHRSHRSHRSRPNRLERSRDAYDISDSESETSVAGVSRRGLTTLQKKILLNTIRDYVPENMTDVVYEDVIQQMQSLEQDGFHLPKDYDKRKHDLSTNELKLYEQQLARDKVRDQKKVSNMLNFAAVSLSSVCRAMSVNVIRTSKLPTMIKEAIDEGEFQDAAEGISVYLRGTIFDNPIFSTLLKFAEKVQDADQEEREEENDTLRQERQTQPERQARDLRDLNRARQSTRHHPPRQGQGPAAAAAHRPNVLTGPSPPSALPALTAPAPPSQRASAPPPPPLAVETVTEEKKN